MPLIRSEMITSFLLEMDWCPIGKLPVSITKNGKKSIVCIDVEPIDDLSDKYKSLDKQADDLYDRRYKMNIIKDQEGNILGYKKKYSKEEIKGFDKEGKDIRRELSIIDYKIAMHPSKWKRSKREKRKPEWVSRFISPELFKDGI